MHAPRLRTMHQTGRRIGSASMYFVGVRRADIPRGGTDTPSAPGCRSAPIHHTFRSSDPQFHEEDSLVRQKNAVRSSEARAAREVGRANRRFGPVSSSRKLTADEVDSHLSSSSEYRKGCAAQVAHPFLLLVGTASPHLRFRLPDPNQRHGFLRPAVDDDPCEVDATCK